MSFLTAEWRKLILANYEIDPEVLQPFVPHKTELDPWQGRHYVSLVGFMFTKVRVLGIPVPFHTHFEEVNLRFYVRRKVDGKWRRGTVFISEIVPLHAVTFLANTLYNEHYSTRPMRHTWALEGTEQRVEYAWRHRGREQHFHVLAARQSQAMAEGSEEEFITEHYWGYNRVSPTKTNEYEVTHPRWEHYPVNSHHIEVDFEAVYGDRFAFLNAASPFSVMLAEGSPITIEGKNRL